MVASAAQRPTIAEAATRLSTLRQSLYGPDVTITRLRDALRRAHERMVRVTGCCVRVSANAMPVNETVVPLPLLCNCRLQSRPRVQLRRCKNAAFVVFDVVFFVVVIAGVVVEVHRWTTNAVVLCTGGADSREHGSECRCGSCVFALLFRQLVCFSSGQAVLV